MTSAKDKLVEEIAGENRCHCCNEELYTHGDLHRAITPERIAELYREQLADTRQSAHDVAIGIRNHVMTETQTADLDVSAFVLRQVFLSARKEIQKMLGGERAPKCAGDDQPEPAAPTLRADSVNDDAKSAHMHLCLTTDTSLKCNQCGDERDYPVHIRSADEGIVGKPHEYHECRNCGNTIYWGVPRQPEGSDDE